MPFGQCALQEGSDKVAEEVREFFARRKDRLQLRRVALLNGSTTEQFENGAGPSMLETLVVTSSKQRCMTFKAAARADGLRKREQTLGESMVETFQGRSDQLLSRKCKYVPDSSESERYGCYLSMPKQDDQHNDKSNAVDLQALSLSLQKQEGRQIGRPDAYQPYHSALCKEQ